MSELPYDSHPAVRRERISLDFINSERDKFAVDIDPKEYLETQDIDEYFDIAVEAESIDIFEPVDGSRTDPFPPQPDDLARVHRLARQRGVMSVLEFGVGYSSIVLADALSKNESVWRALEHQPDIRNSKMFELHVVDASQEWLSQWENMFPEELVQYITFHQSDVHVSTHHGKICSKYDKIPDLIPDFVYLDAPHPKQVEGEVNGLSFGCEERTVMSADLLLMEPTLLPGTCIIVDGRTNNARFLNRNFQREFRYRERPEADVSTFELIEDPLGAYNRRWPLVNNASVSLTEKS